MERNYEEFLFIYLFMVMICEGVQTRYNELTSGYFRQGLHVFLFQKNKNYTN
jgi:hypothetical protein